MSPRLVIMRHAKAEHGMGHPDAERPLQRSGIEEATAAGRWLAEHVGPVDEVLCSTAVRTRQTVEAMGITAPTTYSADIYGGWTDDLLAKVREADDASRTVLLVGHSPVAALLALALADSATDPGLEKSVRSRFPTAAIAVLDCHVPWADLGPQAATLTAFHITA